MVKKLSIIFLCLLMAGIAAAAVTLGLVYGKNEGAGEQQGTEQDGPSSSTGGSADGGSGNNENTDGSGNGGNTGNGSEDGSNNNGGSDSNGNNNGGGINPGTHTCNFVFNSTVAPDCTNVGYDVYLCSTCGKSDRRNQQPALDHDYEWTEHKATCVTDWSRDGVCRRCKDTKTETVPNTKGDHEYVWTVVTPATCTQDGAKTGKCKHCQATDNADIPKLSHSYVYVSDNNASCMRDGTETAQCANCQNTDTRVIPNSKLPHSFGTYVSDNNASCTRDGTETAQCANCQNTDTRIIPNSKLPHSFGTPVPDNNADCRNQGTMTAKCANCTAEQVTPDPNALTGPHIYGAWKTTVNATCVTDGERQRDCTVCGNTEKENTGLGHHSTTDIGAKCPVCAKYLIYLGHQTTNATKEFGEFSIVYAIRELNGDEILCDIFLTQYDVDPDVLVGIPSAVRTYNFNNIKLYNEDGNNWSYVINLLNLQTQQYEALGFDLNIVVDENSRKMQFKSQFYQYEGYYFMFNYDCDKDIDLFYYDEWTGNLEGLYQANGGVNPDDLDLYVEIKDW